MEVRIIQTKTGITYIPVENYTENLVSHLESLAATVILDEINAKEVIDTMPAIYDYIQGIDVK